MSKIRVESDPIEVSISNQFWQTTGRSQICYVENVKFTMPKLGEKGEIDTTKKFTNKLTQRARVRGAS